MHYRKLLILSYFNKLQLQLHTSMLLSVSDIAFTIIFLLPQVSIIVIPSFLVRQFFFSLSFNHSAGTGWVVVGVVIVMGCVWSITAGYEAWVVHPFVRDRISMSAPNIWERAEKHPLIHPRR